MRILCLDVGTKRIGVAVSDQMGWTAQGVAVIERSAKKRDFDRIFDYIKKVHAEEIIVGLPLDSEGRVGVSAKKILKFVDEFKKYLIDNSCSIPVNTWDESFSTVDAETHLIRADVSRKKRRKVIDKMAAVMILKDYLETKGI